VPRVRAAVYAYADPAEHTDAHAYGKSHCYSNGNTYNYVHAYD